METVLAAAITGVLALIGVIVSTRNQANKTRDAGLSQHTEQNKKLDMILTQQASLDKKVDENRRVSEEGLADLRGRVEGMTMVTDTLFGMVVEVDRKVTKSANRKTDTSKKEVPSSV